MADVTTFYPGGTANPVPNATNATNATNAVNADQVDFREHDGTSETAMTGFKFWVGAESDAPMTRDTETLYIFTS